MDFVKNNHAYEGTVMLDKADRYYFYDVKTGEFRRNTYNNRMKWNKAI